MQETFFLFPQQRKSKIAIYHRAQRWKFEIQNSYSCLLLLLVLASTHNSSISMNHLIKSIYLVLIVFNLFNQSASHKIYITMDIDNANNGDSNELSSAASSSSSSSISSLRHHSSEGINRKQKSERSASHRNSVKSRRVYTYTAAQMQEERIDRTHPVQLLSLFYLIRFKLCILAFARNCQE